MKPYALLAAWYVALFLTGLSAVTWGLPEVANMATQQEVGR